MNSITIILAVFFLVIVVANVFFGLHLLKGMKTKGEDPTAKLMFQQINELSRVVDQKMGETNKMVNESVRDQFSESQRLIKEINDQVGKNMIDVVKGLTKLDETNKQVVSFADQLQSLQDILKNPKQRGVLGEYYLETLLKNTLPPGSYEMQYKMTDEDIVDAVVFVKDKIIPIDSKFSLENYNRLIEAKDKSEKDRLEKLFVGDLKMRIQETAKYIRPDLGTTEFAFMFIPHEAIYYDLLLNKVGSVTGDDENLIQRASGKYKVIIVSPTSFLAYLQTVLQGLKAMQIEETAKDIIKRVTELGKHLKGYEEYHSKLGSALGTVVNHYNRTGKEFKKIDKDVLRITGEANNIEAIALDKPEEADES